MNSRGIEQLMDRQQPGWTLEQPFYTDHEIFELEWENIWKKYWLFAGTTAEIPKGRRLFYLSGVTMILLLSSGEIRVKFLPIIIRAGIGAR